MCSLFPSFSFFLLFSFFLFFFFAFIPTMRLYRIEMWLLENAVVGSQGYRKMMFFDLQGSVITGQIFENFLKNLVNV